MLAAGDKIAVQWQGEGGEMEGVVNTVGISPDQMKGIDENIQRGKTNGEANR